jgi:hypothetical protein
MKVYVSHPFGGKPANRELVEAKIIKWTQTKHRFTQLITFVSPIHALGHLYERIPYDEGMGMCLSLLDDCQLMIYPHDGVSEGVSREIDHCLMAGIPVLEYEQFERILADPRAEAVDNVLYWLEHGDPR